jgi:hypothetical protein
MIYSIGHLFFIIEINHTRKNWQANMADFIQSSCVTLSRSPVRGNIKEQARMPGLHDPRRYGKLSALQSIAAFNHAIEWAVL